MSVIGKKRKLVICEDEISNIALYSTETNSLSLLSDAEKTYQGNVEVLKRGLKEYGVPEDQFILNAYKMQFGTIRERSNLTEAARKSLWWSELSRTSVLSKKTTHTTYAMNGVLTVPYQDIPLFYDALCQDIMQGNLHYYCEAGSELKKMNLAFDLDIESMDEPDMWPGVQKMLQVVVDTVQEFFPQRSKIQCVVCLSLPYIKKRDSQSYNHWGAHIYFLDLIVDADHWRQIRNGVADRMKTRLGDRKSPSRNDWSKLVDDNVPRSGLRLIFARRPVTCPYTPSTKKKCVPRSCSLCHGSNGVPGPSFYLPYLFYENGQVNLVETKKMHAISLLNEQEQKKYWLKLINWCTLRPYRTKIADESKIELSPGFRIPMSIPLATVLEPKKGTKKATLKGTVYSAHSNSKRPWPLYPPNAEVYKILKRLWQHDDFRPLLCLEHQKCEFKDNVSVSPRRDVLHLETSCCYCLHLGKAHGRCKIYFIISRLTKLRNKLSTSQEFPTFYLKQHCHCPNYCAGWSSTPLEIPLEISKALFPDALTWKSTTRSHEKPVKTQTPIYFEECSSLPTFPPDQPFTTNLLTPKSVQQTKKSDAEVNASFMSKYRRRKSQPSLTQK